MPTLTEFFSTLYSAVDHPEQYHYELRYLKLDARPLTVFLPYQKLLNFPNTPASVNARAKNEQGYNVYFGVNPRRAQRGDKAHIAVCVALYADIDVKDFLSPAEQETEDIAVILAKKPEVLAATKAQAYALGLKPTLFLDSGRGFQLYWLVDPPVRLPAPESAAWQPLVNEIECKNAALAKVFHGDHVGNIDRIFRFPALANRKPVRKGAAELTNLPVQILFCDPTRRYAFEDFPLPDGQIDPPSPGGLVITTPPAAPTSSLPATEWSDTDRAVLAKARAAKNGAKFSRLFDEGDYTGYVNKKGLKSQSEAEFALCGMLAYWTKNDRAQIDRLFRHSKLYRPKWNTPFNGTTNGWHTIDKIIAQAEAGMQTPPPTPETPAAAEPENIRIAPTGIEVKGKYGWYKIADFGVKLLYRITDADENVTWQAAILPDGDPDVYVTLTHEELATPARFHTALLRKGYVFKGDKYELNLLKEVLIKAAQPAEMVWRLGQHPTGGFVFANGVWRDGQFHAPDAFSMVPAGDRTLYLPFASALHLNKFKNAARIVYTPSAVTLPHWLTLYGTAYGAEGLLPLCFYLAALFRDVAFQKVHFFPILYLRGPHGSGKSSLARSLTALFGYPQPEINLLAPNTAKSLPRLLDQVSNAVLWFNEFKNDLPVEIRALLQAVYDGGGYQRALMSMDNLTTSVEIFSALLLTSNYTPDNDVFVSRCLCVTLPLNSKPDAQRRAYDALQLLEGQGLSSITTASLNHRATIVQEWDQTYAQLCDYFRQTTGQLETRIVANMAVLLTPAVILQQHGHLPLKAVYGDTLELREEGRRQCLIQQAIVLGKGDLTIFFEILTAGVETGRLRRNWDFKVFTSRKEPGRELLALRLHKLSNYYQKEYRTLYNKVGLPKSELETLLQQHPAYRGEMEGGTPAKVHFRNETGKDSPSPAVILDYAVFKQSFAITW